MKIQFAPLALIAAGLGAVVLFAGGSSSSTCEWEPNLPEADKRKLSALITLSGVNGSDWTSFSNEFGDATNVRKNSIEWANALQGRGFPKAGACAKALLAKVKWPADRIGDDFGYEEAARWGASDQQRILNLLLTMVVDAESIAFPDGVRAFPLRSGVPNDDPFLPPFSASAKVGEFVQRGSVFENRRVYTNPNVTALSFVSGNDRPSGWILLCSTITPGPWG